MNAREAFITDQYDAYDKIHIQNYYETAQSVYSVVTSNFLVAFVVTVFLGFTLCLLLSSIGSFSLEDYKTFGFYLALLFGMGILAYFDAITPGT